MNNFQIGLVLATIPLLSAITSILSGNYLYVLGHNIGLKYGVLLFIVSLSIRGSLFFVSNFKFFLTLSYISSILSGIGGGVTKTCALSMVNTFFNSEKELYIGLIEAAIGIGLLIGPLLGTTLFLVYGYCLPFFTIATLLLLIYPLCLYSNIFIEEYEVQL